MKKRLSFIALLLLLLIGLLPVSAFAEETTPFQDIEHWAKDSIIWGYENKLINGVTEDTFSPNGTMNRAMAVTVLHRYNKTFDPELPSSVEADGFDDVPAASYFYDAVKWGQQNGIVNGTSKNTFSPYRAVTRQEFMTMLYRYNNVLLDINRNGGSPWNPSDRDFSIYDLEDSSNYARPAVKWAFYNHIIDGFGQIVHTYPQKLTTRAQMITMIERYHGYRDTDAVLFKLESNDIALISIHNGSGPYVELTEPDDIVEISKKLNQFSYRGKERVSPTKGCDYSINIDYKDTSIPSMTIITYSSAHNDPEWMLKIDNVLYYEKGIGSFTTEWFEKFFDK